MMEIESKDNLAFAFSSAS